MQRRPQAPRRPPSRARLRAGCPRRARTCPSASRGRRRGCSRRCRSSRSDLRSQPGRARQRRGSTPPRSRRPRPWRLRCRDRLRSLSSRQGRSSGHVRHGAAGDVVAASSNRDLEPRLAGDGQSRNDVVLRPAADDQGGPAVDEPVVQGASIVVLRVLRAEEGSEDCSASAVASLGSKDVFTSSPFAIWQDGRAAA